MAKRDSTDKIKGYIDATNNKELILSPLFFRDFSCPSHCGGCCNLKFSLDYFEGDRWEKFKKTYPHLIHKFKKREVNGATVYTNFQDDNKENHCEFLRLEDGRCNIHESNPFSCEFELNKFMVKRDKTYLINKLFGRGWNMMKIDGTRGALCEMKHFNLKKYLRDVEMLKELKTIANAFKIKTPLLSKVIDFLDKIKKPTTKKVIFSKEEKNKNQIKLL